VRLGREVYEFVGDRISQIRQYWTFDPARPGSALVGYAYDADPRFAPAGEIADAGDGRLRP